MPMKHKVLYLLNHFSKRDIQRFKLFLESPYFNKNKRIVTLLQAKDLANKQLEEIHQTLFPDLVYNKQVLKNLLSKLMVLLKKFIAVELIESDHSLMNALALEASEGKIRQQLSKDLRNDYSDNLLSKNDFLIPIKEQLLEYEIEQLLEHRKNIPAIIQRLENRLLLLTEIQTYKSLKLKITYLQAKKRFPEAIQLEEFENLLKSSVDQDLIKHSLLVKIYHTALLLIENPSKANYNSLKDFLFIYADQLHIQHHKILRTILENFCVQQINQGKNEFLKEMYAHLKVRLEINQEKQLSDALIRNIIIVGYRIGKNKEVQQILQQHKKQMKVNVYNYSLAILAFYNKKFEESIQILHKVTLNTGDYQIRVRQLMITNFYALKEYQLVLNQIESFRIWIIRTKIVKKFTKKGTINYLKYLRQFIQLKEKESYEKAENIVADKRIILSKIKNCENIASKKLLTELIEEDIN